MAEDSNIVLDNATKRYNTAIRALTAAQREFKEAGEFLDRALAANALKNSGVGGKRLRYRPRSSRARRVTRKQK
jgi:hypothetical protein